MAVQLRPLGSPEALKPEGDPVDVVELVELARPVAHEVFAGRLDRSLLGLAEKAVVIAVRAPEGDFRAWTAVDDFAGGLAAQLAPRGAAGVRAGPPGSAAPSPDSP